MNEFWQGLVITAVVGAGMMADLYYVFSIAIMAALLRGAVARDPHLRDFASDQYDRMFKPCPPCGARHSDCQCNCLRSLCSCIVPKVRMSLEFSGISFDYESGILIRHRLTQLKRYIGRRKNRKVALPRLDDRTSAREICGFRF